MSGIAESSVLIRVKESEDLKNMEYSSSCSAGVFWNKATAMYGLLLLLRLLVKMARYLESSDR